MTEAEVGMNAYVLIPNALQLVLGGSGIAYEQQLGSSKETLREIYQRLEAIKPDAMAAVLRGLPEEERATVTRCCTFCLRHVPGEQTEAMLGIPREVAAECIAWLMTEE